MKEILGLSRENLGSKLENESCKQIVKKHYSKPIKEPMNEKEGLQNRLQFIINFLEEGNIDQAILDCVDMIDALNSYAIKDKL